MKPNDLKPMDVVVGGLVSSAILVDLNISTWTGRKTAKDETKKVVQEAGAKASDAAHVTKKLFVGNPLFDEITKQSNRMRTYVLNYTLPWMGDLRLLAIANFEKFQDDMGSMKNDFDAAVEKFCKDYDVQVSAAAFKLGSMFDRNEYPPASAIRSKFRVHWDFSPVPTSGDFRVDAENRLRQEMQEVYERAMQERVESSMRSMWERLHECLTHLADRLGKKEDGKNNIFRDSMLENAKELVNLLEVFNITGDQQLEQARRKLLSAIDGVEPDELRKNDNIRADVKSQVDEILQKFSFDGF